MKKNKLIILGLVASSIGLATTMNFSNTSKNVVKANSKVVNGQDAVSTTSSKNVMLTNPNTSKMKSVVDSDLAKKHEMAMTKVVYAMKEAQEKIEELGYNEKEVFKDLAELGPKDFFNSLPDDLKPAFEKINNLAEQAQDIVLKQDGRTRDDIKEYKVHVPKWVEAREKELQQVSIDNTLQKFLDKKSKDTAVSNDDVKFIINSCNSEKDCVEKSFMQLISANHQLSQEQFEIINNSI